MKPVDRSTEEHYIPPLLQLGAALAVLFALLLVLLAALFAKHTGRTVNGRFGNPRQLPFFL